MSSAFDNAQDLMDFNKVMYRLACLTNDLKIDRISIAQKSSGSSSAERFDRNQFEDYLEKLDPKVSRREKDLIARQFKDPSSDRLSILGSPMLRFFDDVLEARDKVLLLVNEISKKLLAKQSTIDKYFDEQEHNGFFNYFNLQKLIGSIGLSVNTSQMDKIFMIMNDFENDRQISKDQFCNFYNKEIIRAKAVGLTAPPLQPVVQTTPEATDKLKGLVNTFAGIRSGLDSQRISSVKNFLEKTGKVTDGKIKRVDYEQAIRELSPTIDYIDLEKLTQLQVEQGTDLIPVNKTDQLSTAARQFDNRNPICFGLTLDNHIISEWFVLLDGTPRTGKVSFTAFINGLKDGKVTLIGKEAELLKSHYRADDSAPNAENPNIDYVRFEKDVGFVYGPYVVPGAASAQSDRQLETVVRDLAKKIFEKYDSFEAFYSAKAGSKKSLNRDDLWKAFRELDPSITPKEFSDISKQMEVSTTSSILAYNIAKYFKPKLSNFVSEISGRILNGYDKTKESLATKIARAKGPKVAWILMKDLHAILKEYYSELKENDLWAVIVYFNVSRKNIDSIKYTEFTDSLHSFLKSTHIRKSEELQEFFTQSSFFQPLGGASPGGTSQAPGQSPTAGGQTAKPADAVATCFLELKQNMMILNRSDAIEAFRVLDKNGSGTVTRDEFDTYVKNRIPKFTDQIRGYMYKYLDPTNTGTITEDQFLKVMLQQVPDVLDRHALLVSKTKNESAIFKKLNEVFDAKSTSLQNLFTKPDVKSQEILDTFKNNLNVVDTQGRIKAILDIFAPPEGNQYVNMDEFSAVLEHYRKKQFADESTTGDAMSPTKGARVTETRVNDIIKSVRDLVKSNPQFLVSKYFSMFDTFDKDGNSQTMTLAELHSFLKSVDRTVTEAETKEIYRRIDRDGKNDISKREMTEFLTLDLILKDEKIASQVKDINAQGKFSPILRDLTYNSTIKKKILLDKVLPFHKQTMELSSFNQVLSFFEVDLKSYPQGIGKDFIEYLTIGKKKDTVDLMNLQMLLDKFNQDEGRNLIKANVDDDTEIMLFEMLQKFNSDPNLVVKHYDPTDKDRINLAEFTIITKAKVIPTATSDECKKVYNQLRNPQDNWLSAHTFLINLYKVAEKYNQGAQALLPSDSMLDMSLNNMSIGSPNMMASSPNTKLNSYRSSGFILQGIKAVTPIPADQSNEPFAVVEPTAQNSASHPDLLMRDPRMAGGLNKNLTPEEIKKNQLEVLFANIRRDIHYLDQELFKKLRAEDEAKTNMMHKDYVFSVLASMGARLTDTEKDTLVDICAKDKGNPDMLLYLDIYNKLFPTKQLTDIKTTKDLATELIKQLTIAKRPFKQLWLQAVGSPDAKFMSEENFKTMLASYGISLSKEVREKMFKDLDKSRDKQLELAEFKAAFLNEAGCSTGPKLARSLRLYIKGLNKSPEEFFSPHTKTKSLDFGQFTTALTEANFPIQYVEIEELFGFLDNADNGKLTLEELQTKLEVKPTAEKPKFDPDNLRTKMYIYMKANHMNLMEFFDSFHPGFDFWRFDDFEKMVNTVGLTGLDKEKDIRPMFEAIESSLGNATFRIEFNELEQFFDSARILLLFPFVLQFKSALLEYIKRNNQPSYYLVRRFAKDSDKKESVLDEDGFKKLTEAIGLTTLGDDNIKIIFREFDQGNDGTVSASEIRRCLSPIIVDVVDLSERVKRLFLGAFRSASQAYNQTVEKSDDGMNFAKFKMLLQREGNFTDIEVEELFLFVCLTDSGKIKISEFLSVFDTVSFVNPFQYNPRYIEELTDDCKVYYVGKYRSMRDGNAIKGKAGYDRTKDDALIKRAERLQRGGGGFVIVPEPATQAAIPGSPVVEQPRAGVSRVEQITRWVGELDKIFVSKIDIHKQTDSLQTFFQKCANPDTMRIPPEGYDMLLKDIRMWNSTTPEERRQIIEHIWQGQQGEKGEIDLVMFKKYYDTVKLVLESEQADPRMLRKDIAEAFTKIAIQQGIEPDEVFNRFKKRGKYGLLPDEFMQLVDSLHLDHNYNPKEIEDYFKSLNIKTPGQLSFDELKVIFDENYEVYRQRLQKVRDDDLIQVVRVTFSLTKD